MGKKSRKGRGKGPREDARGQQQPLPRSKIGKCRGFFPEGRGRRHGTGGFFEFLLRDLKLSIRTT